MPRRRESTSCFVEPRTVCGEGKTPPPRSKIDEEFARKVGCVLKDQHVVISSEERDRFIKHLSDSIRLRKVVAHQYAKNRNTGDIIGLIQIARDAGDLDEAIWRCFLAAHFGRASADEKQMHQIRSASDFLCAFGAEPFWTWKRVSEHPTALHKWLAKHKADLQTLSYGNHRKYESKQADDIWKVIESFLALAEQNGGPLGLVAIDPKLMASDQFDLLYRRLRPLVRFGRTGRFDFLGLLIDVKLISAEPASCYLRDSTGPKDGAKRLWGKRSTGQLEYLAADMAERLGILPMALEDALCNWQK